MGKDDLKLALLIVGVLSVSLLVIVVEVADTSVAHDRDIKVALYARYGIPEVWLVDLEEMRLEVYYGPQGTDYSHVDFYRSGVVAPKAFVDVAVDLGALVFPRS